MSLFSLQAGRGLTLDLVLIDEACFVRSLTTQLSYAQHKGTKLMLTSSANTASEKSSSLIKCKDMGIPFYYIVFTCPEDVLKVSKAQNAVACHHYILGVPPYISTEANQKLFMNTLESNSFTTESLGVVSENEVITDPTTGKETILEDGCLFRSSILNDLSTGTNDFLIDTTTKFQALSNIMYVYVDPAYTSNSRNSATGICIMTQMMLGSSHESVTSKNTRKLGVILGVEEYRIPYTYTWQASVCIGGAVACLIIDVLYAHSHHFKKVVIGIESNSSESDAVFIAKAINKACNVMLQGSLDVHFTHRLIKTGDIRRHGATNLKDFGTREVVGFWLGPSKSTYCKVFCDDFNQRKIRSSLTPYSRTIQQSEIHKFIADQLTKFRLGSKPKDKSQNDVAIAMVMSYYLMMLDKNSQLTHLIHPITD